MQDAHCVICFVKEKVKSRKLLIVLLVENTFPPTLPYFQGQDREECYDVQENSQTFLSKRMLKLLVDR